MKHLTACIVLILLTAQVSFSQQIWTENFESYGNGTTTGTAGGTIGGNWNSSVPGGTFSKGSILGNRFYAFQTTGEGVWITDPIDISGTGRVIIDMNVFGVIVGAGDYIRCYYTVDGGPETLFFEQDGGLLNFSLSGSAIITGNSMEIIIRSAVDGGLTSFSFDDIIITAVNTLYSRKSGNWNDITPGSGTWSLAALGGTSCDCSPLATDYLIIGNSNTININVAATAGGIEVRNTGTLQWAASSIDLNIDRGILQVDAGGTISRNGQTGVQIDFDRGIFTSFIVNGTVTTEDIELTVPDITMDISGSGSISTTGDFRLLEDEITVNNNLTGTFTIGDDLIYDQPSSGGLDNLLEDNAHFVNNQTLTITSDILVGANTDDDNGFTNSAGAVLNVVNLNFANGDFDFFNSGIVNQSGNFSGISTADTNVDNLAGSAWNWSLTPNTTFDTDIATVMNLTAVSNTFTYSAGGAQRIIPTSYNNLTLSNSGAKDANNASFAVGGNWLVSGSASFSEGTGTVTLNGTSAQAITNPLGETFNNLTVNNTFATSPQITLNNPVTVTNVLTMTDGNVDLNGNNFTLSSTASGALVHGLTSASGWMYDGSMIRNRPASTSITVGTAHSLFPLGSSGDWRPFFVGQTSDANTAGTITISHTNNINTTTVAFAEGITRRHDAYWTLLTATMGAGATFNLRAGGTNFGTIQEFGDLRMSTSTGVVGAHVTGSGGPTDWRVNRQVVFGDINNNYHVASTDAVNSPLPVELVNFSARVVPEGIQLDWTTASELNNDFFTVERSASGEDFTSVGKVNGQGTTSNKNAYTLTDTYPLYGKSYYRLRQTDFDGTFTYSSIISVVYDGPTTAVMQVYPNPSNGREINIELLGLDEAENISVVVYDHLGREYSRFLLSADNAGHSVQRITFKEVLPQGVYILKAGQTPQLTKRLVITH